MILLDTSVLIDALTRDKRSAMALRRMIEEGERIIVSCLAHYEWLRGPRLKEELAAQENLFPAEQAVPFGPEEAVLSAEIYRAVRRPREREVDIAIAASAIIRAAELWTLNEVDFRDIPGLRLHAPAF